MTAQLSVKFVDGIADIPEWDDLAPAQPFLRADFLNALESSGSVGAGTGWQPYHLTLWQNQLCVGVMPLYLKTHSYGEYVFDFAWADAYFRHGHDYYPKLVSAVPFTPVTGPRLLLADGVNAEQCWPTVVKAIQAQCQTHSWSSCHILFPEQSIDECQSDLLTRTSVQFHWFNRQYTSFADFLETFTSRKRKSVRRERRKLADAGIHFERLTGERISESVMNDFINCYQQTYLKRSGHLGYLNEDFFHRLRTTMSEQMLIIRALHDNTLLGSALLFFDQTHLYGRYWGALEELDGLHFETCYYQGIEFAIERQLSVFNPGTQGEHKIQRGFEPTLCHSAHWLAEPSFYHAVADFVARERPHIAAYAEAARERLPFRCDD